LTRIVAVVRDTVIVLAFVAGPPAGLYLIAGSPIPASWPTGAVWRDWAQDPLRPAYAHTAAIIAGWLLWAVITVVIVAAVAMRLPRPNRLRRLPLRLPGPVQSLTATLLGAVAVTNAATPAAAALANVTAPATPSPADPDQVADRGPAAGHAGAAPRMSAASPTPSARVCTVKPGDTLFAIAERQLGDGDRWTEIFHLNRGIHYARVGGTLTDPDLIYPGWTLTLPAATARPTDAPQAPPARARTTPSASGEPASASGDHPSNRTALPDPNGPSTAPAASPSRGDRPAPSRTSAVTTAPPAPASRTSTPVRPIPQPPRITAPAPADTDDWVEVAGGIISAGLAAGLVYAAAQVWRLRRHRYRPGPLTAADAGDPGLAPPLAALTRLRHRVRRSDQPTYPPAPTVRQYLHAIDKPSLPPPGPTGTDLAGLGRLPHTGGVGLTGPAAASAARAALIAALTAGSPDTPQARSTVILPADTATTLLPAAAHLGTCRLSVVPTFTAALARTEEEVIRRNRLLTEHDAADLDALRAAHTFAEPLPPLLLIGDVPPPTWHPRLAATLALGVPVDIGAVLIGDWPAGPTLTVNPDGTTTGTTGSPRIAVLDEAAATELLAMLTEAHGDTTVDASPHADITDSDGHTPAAAGDVAATLGRPPSFSDGAYPPVQGRILGPPAILNTDGQPVRGLRAKSLELFVHLAVHRSGARLEDIMEALWPDVTVSRAADRLSTCVANLRTTIRTIARATTGDDGKIEPVINTGGHYHLNPDLIQVDWWTVQDAATEAAAATDDAARLTHLHMAVAAAHPTGLADGSDYDWIDTDREHVRRRLLTIYSHTASLLADTDPDTSRELHDTACTLDPLSEPLARAAMQAAARLGDAEGIRHRRTLLRTALDDADIDIDAATEHLAHTLLNDLRSDQPSNASTPRPPTPHRSSDGPGRRRAPAARTGQQRPSSAAGAPAAGVPPGTRSFEEPA
jgi:DNA-binding SARP family transcriptional activator